MANFTYDKHFIKFKKNLEDTIASFTSSNEKEEFTKKQKKLVEDLVKSENNFKKVLMNHTFGKQAYVKFINYIVDENKNILSARPFFRERQKEFSSKISPALKERNVDKLAKFDINFPFINFVVNCIDWPRNSKIRKAAKEVQKIREEIILQNMPLAISRATLFRKKTPESHLSFMDINQIAFEGLINAVDKFVLPYTTVYRSVIIGRISGDLIENYSETMLHFYPSDKRKIYRANKVPKSNEATPDQIADIVNSGPKLESLTTGNEIRHLTMAASPLSLDTPIDEQKSSTFSELFVAPDSFRPDLLLENLEEKGNLNKAFDELSVFEKKILKMKGLGL